MRCRERQTLALGVVAVPWEVGVFIVTMVLTLTLAAMMAEVMLADMDRRSRAVEAIRVMVLEVMVVLQLDMDMDMLILERHMEIMGLQVMEAFLLRMLGLTAIQLLLLLVTRVALQALIEDPGAVKLHLVMALGAMLAVQAMVHGIALLLVEMHPLVRHLVQLQVMETRAMVMVGTEGMHHMVIMEAMVLMGEGEMVLVILLLVQRLGMVLDMEVGMATLDIQMRGLILHKVEDLAVQSMELLKANQIMAAVMVVCNLGLLSKRGHYNIYEVNQHMWAAYLLLRHSGFALVLLKIVHFAGYISISPGWNA